MGRTLTDPRLIMQPLPPLHVPRARLLSVLDNARERETPLILLSAGPGTGKTVLLSAWARRHDDAVAWMTVTPAENEPHRFWRLFLSAVRARSASADDLPPSVASGGATALLESLFMHMPPPVAPLVLIIDDAHVLTHPHVLDGLDCVVHGWYPQLRLVLAARSDPLLPLHRYRLAGRMCELRAADLAMSREESRQLLAAHGVTLPADAFDLLAARTEGWAAGIRLSALRMAGAERPEDFVAELSLDQGSIGEYLIDEVLNLQPAKVRHLLLQTGFLDQITGPLADAVTGLDGSTEILSELARSNSFVTPLDPAQTRFRYHQLLGEILQHLMQQQAPRIVPTLYKRAAGWYEAQGDLRTALKWVARAGDGLGVASLLARGGLAAAFVDRHDLPNAAAWLTQLDQVSDVDEPQAAEVRSARLALMALLAGPDVVASDDEAGVAGDAPDDPELALTTRLARLILAEKAGKGEVVDEMADQLLDARSQRRLRAVPGLRAAVLLSRARTHFWAGRFHDIEELLREARTAARSDSAAAIELDVVGMMALVDTYFCRPARADEAARQAGALQQADVNLSSPLTLELAAALRAFVQADFTGMARAVRRAAGASGTEWDPAAAGLLAIVRALALLGCGQHSEARSALHEIPALRHVPVTLAAHRDMVLATIELALGRPHSALHLLRPYRKSGMSVPVEVPRARAYRALGDLDQAQDCVRRVLTGETATVCRYVLVEALLCGADIAQAQSNAGRAVEMLVRAIEIADGTIPLPFVRTADLFAPLLRRHPTIAAIWPRTTAEIRSDIEVELPQLATSPFPEALTDRERAVLRLLTTSMSTGEIADELCVSVNTVKTHLAAIYRKLGARRRREAVLRAREYEML